MPRYRVALRKGEWETFTDTLEATGRLEFNEKHISVWSEGDEPVLVVPAGLVAFVEEIPAASSFGIEVENVIDLADTVRDIIGKLKKTGRL